MEDLLIHLLSDDPELARRVYQLTLAMPGYQEAALAFDVAAQEVQDILGFERYDRYITAQTRLASFDCRASYALGLGLREELAKALTF